MNITSRLMMVAVVMLLLLASGARAQQSEASKIEIGAQFSSLTMFPPRETASGLSVSVGLKQTEPGFGLRFTYNLNNHLALEAEGNFFPHRELMQRTTGGRVVQGQFGLKAGKRFEKFGIFAKARPGFVSYGEVLSHVGEETFDFNGQPFTFLTLQPERRTYFSMDVGAALELYPSRRVVARFDAGDTIIRQGRTPDSGPIIFEPTPPSSTHNFQFSAGLALRLLIPSTDNDETQTSGTNAPRFEIGAQFSSLSLNSVERSAGGGVGFGSVSAQTEFHDTQTAPGFGGRFTYNVTDHFALEAEGNFFPHKHMFINEGRGGGRISQGQFGARVGRRWNSFGLFGKARPGLVSFSRAFTVDVFRTGEFERRTHFSFDLGGVLEFYPSRRVVARFDAGDTIIRYGSSSLFIPNFFPSGTLSQTPAETRHNFQFTAGVGFRF
ncbi:MAG: hypothetical protein QOF02_635 [Blastocatellia bacterium]|jgi:hypothetical protein|nr:hypothetical protein [Blastocatellia bacterium]